MINPNQDVSAKDPGKQKVKKLCISLPRDLHTKAASLPGPFSQHVAKALALYLKELER